MPDPYYILLVLYVVSQLISTELMLSAQTDKSQKMLMRAMPIMFVFFLFNFPAGLFVYWVTTNVWTIGQQLLIRKVMKPKDLATMTAKPAKRSRFMEALTAAQGERMQTREELIAKQKAERAKQGAPSRAAPSRPAAAGGQEGRPQGPARQGQEQAEPAAGGSGQEQERPGGRLSKPPAGPSSLPRGAEAAMTEPDDLQPVDDGEDDDTEFATIAGAATIQEAKRKALDQLRKVVPYVNEADVDFVVMEEGSKGGFFGRGKSEARVEARVRPAGERVADDLRARRRGAARVRADHGRSHGHRGSCRRRRSRRGGEGRHQRRRSRASSSGGTAPPSTPCSTSPRSSSTATVASGAR